MAPSRCSPLPLHALPQALRPCLPSQVRDSLGRLVELPQDTHPGHYRRETSTIHSSAIVRLTTPLRSMPPGAPVGGAPPACPWGSTNRAAHPCALPGRCRGCRMAGGALHVLRCAPAHPCPPAGSTLFLEIKHWKAEKRRFSTLAWAYAPLDKLVDSGPSAVRVGTRTGLQRHLGLSVHPSPVLATLPDASAGVGLALGCWQSAGTGEPRRCSPYWAGHLNRPARGACSRATTCSHALPPP